MTGKFFVKLNTKFCNCNKNRLPLVSFTPYFRKQTDVLDVLFSYSLIKNVVLPAYKIWILVGINDVNY